VSIEVTVLMSYSSQALEMDKTWFGFLALRYKEVAHRNVLLSAPKCTMPVSSKVRNNNPGRTAGVAAWAA